MSGETTPAPRGRRGRRAENATLDRCVKCRELHEVSSMLAWSDGMWCLLCAAAALHLERFGDPAAAEGELREIDAERRRSNRREDAERRGVGLVRDRAETM